MPREIALGKFAQKRIPGEFLPQVRGRLQMFISTTHVSCALGQDVTVTNPPTLLLVVEALSDSDHPSIRTLYPRVKAWVDWMIHSQRGRCVRVCV